MRSARNEDDNAYMRAAVAVIISLGWLAFWLGWLAAAMQAKPGRTFWGRFMWVRLVVIALVLVLIRVRPFHSGGVAGSPWLLGIGLVLFVAGLALAVWARVHIAENWGMPMSQKADPELVTTGPYGLIRHPIYTGMILAMIGTAIALSPYWLAPVVVLGGYFVYSATREERYLVERFPDTYPSYQRSTKMLIPFIF